MKLNFEQWREANFDKVDEKDIHSEEGNESVLVTVKLSNGKTNQVELRNLAVEDLRSFSWKKFKKDLFMKSPREMASEREKIMTYFLSSETIVKDDGKIDYFLSHSWMDNGKWKCDAM